MGEIQHVHGGNLREAAEKYGLNTTDFLDFSANINPLGPSKKAIEAIKENLDQIAHYPDPECTMLRQLLVTELGVDYENIIVGNGAAELIFLLMGQIRPRKVLIPAPTFSEYEMAVKSSQGLINYFNLKSSNNYKIDVDAYIDSLPGHDLTFICNPNNPTGQILEGKDLIKIIAAGQRTGTMIVVDESFVDFLKERDKYSVARMIKEYDNLLVLYSLTKFFAIPGLRLGVAIGQEDLIKRLNNAKDPWNVNCLAQLAGVVSLKDRDYINNTITYINQEKDNLFEHLNNIKGLKPFPPSVNYIFIDVSGTGFSSTELKDKLGAKGILVRDCSSYNNLDNRYIRVAVKDTISNLQLISALQELKGINR